MHELLARAPYVSYDIIQKNNLPYSICDAFTNDQLEFVSARSVLNSEKKSNEISYFQHYKNICKKHGLSDVDEFMNYMLLTDYLIVNIDRHMNNLGILRNVKTLKWITMAPIFDSGNSLWYSTPKNLICPKNEVKTESFRDTQSRMLELVNGCEWVNTNKIHHLDEEFFEVLKHSVLIDAARREKLCEGMKKRMDMLVESMNQITTRNK